MSAKKSHAKTTATEAPSPSREVVVETSPPPGEAEEKIIHYLYNEARQGMRAYVLMGAWLLDVKARLAHGEFLPWLGIHAAVLRKSALYNAMSMARRAADLAEISNFQLLEILKEPDSEGARKIWALVDGQSQRRVLAEIREERTDDAEAKARATCERLWKSDPLLRDEWEPVVLGGGLDYCDALRAMSGQIATKGKRRAAPDYRYLLPKVFITAQRGFGRWGDLDVETRAEVTAGVRELARSAPPEVRAALLDELGASGSRQR